MIVVIGSIVVRDGHLDEALTLGRAHVRRSRTEPGCISHDVHHDSENHNRLVFVERWVDHASLMQHFAVPESNTFVRSVSALAERPPSIEIYDANEV